LSESIIGSYSTFVLTEGTHAERRWTRKWGARISY